ncbi:phosphatidylinositol 4,5-bisphosphate 3-kinase catalytic subunit delta isoform-like isoform X2 [Hyla sarda]|uniref:phosphatidylinositol 4,5-bisphosphate 3-kinase catalytic subunit delta isoform-like isoform X2 n=1 Tax=Hyla sarda TaxID=327740 RepID=UPI0024C3E014|nr:phosphatidylinositol 4,5-bisphosphate 3-kinase catalytic subunit delta isoform-like isoform X2 [Hyla sarda]
MAQKDPSYVNVHPGTSEVEYETAPGHPQTPPKRVNIKGLPKGFLDVDILLPNGIHLSITVPFSSTMANLKKIVWHRAYKEPLFSLLHHPSFYTFMCIDHQSDQHILQDHHRLCEVDFFLPIFKIVLKENKQPKILPSRGLKLLLDRDLQVIRDPEVDMFWYRVRKMYETIMESQGAMSEKEWLDITYPPQLDHFAVSESSLQVVVNIHGSEEIQTIGFDPTRFPMDLIGVTLQNRPTTSGKLTKMRSDAFVLKVTGMDDYLHGERSLFRFKYISECMRYGITPHLTITPLAFVTHRENVRDLGSSLSLLRLNPNLEDMVISGRTSLWDLKRPFMIQITEGSNVTLAEGCKVMVRAGLFHGHDPLCQYVETTEVNASSHPVWQQNLQCDIDVCDLPRMTRLCLSLCSIHGDGVFVTRRKVAPIAWVNMMVFDHSHKLNSGHQSLTLWSPPPDTIEDSLNPTGSVGRNPDPNGATLKVCILSESPDPVYYPSIEEIIKLGKSNTAKKVSFEEVVKLGKHGGVCSLLPEEEQLQAVLYQTWREELSDREKDLIWEFRREIQRWHPECLAKLLLSTKWNCHVQAAQMIYLLQSWSEISSSSALELLGRSFPDPSVEMFAVRCLRSLSDEELSNLLPQLVQVLKTKAYVYNEVSAFLLERAFVARGIGHQLFWLLRSEMNEPVNLVFSIILEAFCSIHVSQHIQLVKQVQAVNRMGALYKFVHMNYVRKEELKMALQERLKLEKYSGHLSFFCSPLDPKVVLTNLCEERCSLTNSKVKPLLLVFNTDVHGGSHFGIILKSGDDLRQEMLVLNLIKMMDHLWKAEGLDLRMVSYGCVSMATQMGLIEAVLQSETIGNIHQSSGRRAMTAAFHKEAIFNWLRDKHPGESLQRAMEEFTRSCAGYWVAAYVLGIGDGASDKILIRVTGQVIFHGHNLGKCKTKFGLRQEHPPFILTPDILHVIQHGTAHNQIKLDWFRCVCEKAYSVLRKNRRMFLNMVSLMNGAGLSEPNSSLLLHYMKDSLGVHMTDEEALKNFQIKFEAAIRNDWKVKLSRWAHNLSADKR